MQTAVSIFMLSNFRNYKLLVLAIMFPFSKRAIFVWLKSFANKFADIQIHSISIDKLAFTFIWRCQTLFYDMTVYCIRDSCSTYRHRDN